MNGIAACVDDIVLERGRLPPGFSTSHVERLFEPDTISLYEMMGDAAGHEFVQAMWAQAMEGVIVANEQGAIMHFNAVAERAFGYRAAEVLGLTLPKLVPTPVLEEFLTSGADAMDFEKVQGVRRNGSALPMKLKMARILFGERVVWVIYVRDISEIHQQRLEIERLAHVDALTGLPNRNLLNERLGQTLALARRYHRTFAFLYIDLDRFKQVNDSYGHEMGDRVLREIGRRLKSCVRDTDTVARIGGDEFVALLTDLRHEDDVRIIADRFLTMCRTPVNVGEASFQLGGSVGIAVYPVDGNDVEKLQRHADAAMYHAKSNGRNQFAFYTRELNSAAERKTMIERGLQRALKNDDLVLHYQPQIDLHTGQLVGAEALMRWNDNGTMMQPAEFIPVAEESGLIVAMGEWALREACRKGQQWRRMGLGAGVGVRVGVNLSVRQFTDSLPDLVFSILRDTGLPPELLDLEVTESFLASDRNAVTILRKLQEGGVHLSVDDFGTGYSCLAYLKQLPLHTIKIDRSFVRELDDKDAHHNRAVVETIITLADKLGRSTLAEGVETEAQAQALREMGVCHCQGFMYSRPLPELEFERFAQNNGMTGG